MTTIIQPNVNIDITGQPTPSNVPQKVLFVGQMLSGTATSGNLVQNIGVSGEENALFGRASFLAGMIRAARKINKDTQFDAIPLADNGAGVQAEGEVVFSGTATATGTFTISVGSRINHQYVVGVSSGDTATVIGDNLETLINNDINAPFTAVNTTGTVVITCRHKGTIGNFIGLLSEGIVTGVTVSLTAFASGATDPSLTGIFTPVQNIRYQTIVWPNTYTKSTVTTFLDARWNVPNAPMDGVAITSQTNGTSSFLTALALLDTKSLVYFCNKTISTSLYKGSSLFELDDEVASQFAAVRSLRLTTGADISSLVIGGGGQLDTFGGISLSSLPYANTPFPNLPLTDADQGFSDFEIQQLGAVGGSVIGNSPANNTVICGIVYTTYKTDSAGNDDTSFLFLNTQDIASVSREYQYVNIRAAYAQCRLTTGTLIEGRLMANAGSIRGEMILLYQSLVDLAVLQGGDNALDFYNRNLFITIDVTTNSVSVINKLPPVGQLRNINIVNQIVFQNFGQ